MSIAGLVHERDVLLKSLADAAENCVRLRQERDRLKSQLADLESTLATLRAKGKRLVADRDRWEAAARQGDSELAELSDLAGTGDKFRQAKAVLSKALHPDNAKGAGDIERTVRTVIFQEIWPEIVKIDRGAG